MESLEEKVYVFMDEQYYYNYYSNIEESEVQQYDSPDDLWWLENSDDPPQRTFYWESQASLLQEILERYQLTGSKLRREVGGIMKVVKASEYCSCFKNPNSLSSNCTSCLRRQVVSLLRDRGFTTNLCVSKWGPTRKFPGGSHEYIEVMASTSTRKKQIPVLIELEFRDQFQIAKAGEEYQKLVSCLPEFYIGKPDYLTAIIRVMCETAKKSMKEKKMHMGPWRKSGFMQMKWSGFNQTCTSDKSHLTISGAFPAVVVT